MGKCSKFKKNRASKIYFFYATKLVRPGGIEPPRILSTASLVLRVYQFRHDRIYFVYFDKNMFFFQPFYDIIMLIIVKGKEKI